jgi:transcriptional regulator GlxA family with amidase domain
METLHFGALVYDYQLTDVFGPFDLLASSTKKMAEAMEFFDRRDEETLRRAPEFIFHHIGEALEPVRVGSISIVPTTTVDDCPELDYLLLGGPWATFQLPLKYQQFIRRHVDANKTLFTTCTGSHVAALAGVLDGKNATINHLEYKWIKTNFPKVNWTNEKKWVVDGNIWTSAGAVAGMDMFAYWLQKNYGLAVLTQGALVLDYEPRNIDGVLDVLPKRYDANGKQISTHIFPNQDS